MHSFIQGDSQSIALLKRGEGTAFAALYRKYASELFRYVRKNIGVKEDCEEIIQDIFLDIWARREKLDHVTNLEGYLYKMVRYKVIRYFQHKSVVKKFEKHYRLFEVLYEDSQMEETKKTTFQERITSCLSDLPERCQEAFRLRFLENLSNGEIAKRMNISKTTVENYIVKAYSHIRTSGKKEFLKLG